jgi:hypothetical protein
VVSKIVLTVFKIICFVNSEGLGCPGAIGCQHPLSTLNGGRLTSAAIAAIDPKRIMRPPTWDLAIHRNPPSTFNQNACKNSSDFYCPTHVP